MKPIIRKPLHDRRRLFTDLGDEPSQAKQAFKAECDINNIMARYEQNGIVTHMMETQGRYSDFLDAPDYQEGLNQIIAAQDAFGTLPASVRKRFNNNPAEFLDFVHNPDNLDEMIKLGLRDKPTSQPTEPLRERSESKPAGETPPAE